MSWTFNGYYLNGTRQDPTKDDHAQDAQDQTDGDIKLCRLSGRSRELETRSTYGISEGCGAPDLSMDIIRTHIAIV